MIHVLQTIRKLFNCFTCFNNCEDLPSFDPKHQLTLAVINNTNKKLIATRATHQKNKVYNSIDRGSSERCPLFTVYKLVTAVKCKQVYFSFSQNDSIFPQLYLSSHQNVVILLQSDLIKLYFALKSTFYGHFFVKSSSKPIETKYS